MMATKASEGSERVASSSFDLLGMMNREYCGVRIGQTVKNRNWCSRHTETEQYESDFVSLQAWKQ